ncbi:NAD(P)-dependent alcohol dehydrogenase [Mesorhizobium abyssinicae]|uniref:NAD(P)-dependent alcohol dehydrogenase n=1 Tax=Mesorhizobium abyssinicae TaxID=1209958 RepID=A0ABU5AMX0_9HYPH|nr:MULTISPECIES: NAD(P)-dependent alcohol dehydrogenase [Mesorhizobium]MDX8538616.1 NAD(P)-dependent alcohol dehydrogenase [Mesorhizobium abyssinicae]
MDDMTEAWRMTGFGLDKLVRGAVPLPSVGRRALLVAVRAVALNFKDLLLIDGKLPAMSLPFVPASDAVGEVVAIGSEVTRFRVGDRVLGQVIADWADGDGPPVLHRQTLGLSLPGVLARHVVFGEDAAVPAPASLGDEEAATLPIAALTAWSALVESGRSRPGTTVLIEGTGGVALFALQFALAFGQVPILLSRHADKLERARMLGARLCLDTGANPDWSAQVRTLRGGRGVDHVLELIGGANLRQSIETVAAGGLVSLIGQLAGTELAVPTPVLTRNRITLQGIATGSRRQFEHMNVAIEALGVRPVIDAVYPFEAVHEAFDHQRRGPFGKVVISMG